MKSKLFEYTGEGLDTRGAAAFSKVVSSGFYLSETKVACTGFDHYILNARALAGNIPIAIHKTGGGVQTTTKRSWQQIRNDRTDAFLVWLVLKGSVTIVQNGKSTVIGPNNVVLSSSNEAICVVTNPDEDREHLSYQIIAPSHIVTNTLSDPKRLCGVSYPTDNGGARIASRIFQSLYDEAENFHPSSAEQLALAAIETSLRFIGESDDQPMHLRKIGEERLERVIAYLKFNFADSELTTEKVAGACSISTRYLHYLLMETGRTYYGWLWELRLNNAYAQLVDPALMRRNVAEIAYMSGFKSSAHFSRAFRVRFQCSPRELRQQSQNLRDSNDCDFGGAAVLRALGGVDQLTHSQVY